jgi:hypothetical protein
MTNLDSPRGMVEFFEDFIGWDIMADKPEYGVDTDPAIEIVATAPNGVARITMDGGEANIGGILFGQTQWDITNGIYVEARVRLSAIRAANERVGVWLTDLQEDTLGEYPFTLATTVATAAADPNDAVGIFWEGDTTNGSWYALSQNTDNLVVNGIGNQSVFIPPVADEWQTLSFDIAPGGLVAEFYVDGKPLYRYSGSTSVVADVPLILVWGCQEGTGAINADLDYVYVRSSRQ